MFGIYESIRPANKLHAAAFYDQTLIIFLNLRPGQFCQSKDRQFHEIANQEIDLGPRGEFSAFESVEFVSRLPGALLSYHRGVKLIRPVFAVAHDLSRQGLFKSFSRGL